MNETKAGGFFDEAKGKIKQVVGETFHDDSMANSGAADEVKGHAEQTWGSVKDSAHNLGHSDTAEDAETTAENTGNSLRDKVTQAAEHAKESIQHGLGNVERKAND